MGEPSAGSMNAFFDAYYRRRPVNASFIGIHDHDDFLPDFSDEAISGTIAEMESLRKQLSGDSIDEQLARNYLAIQIAEFRGDHFHRSNPAIYTGEAIFGVLTSRARLRAVPRLLAQGKENVRTSPPEWTRRAMRECIGAMTILKQLSNDGGADAALKAFQDFHDYLSSELLHHPSDAYGCGREFFDLLVAKGHMLQETGEEILRFANQEFTRHAAAETAADEPIIQDLEEHQKCWDRCRQLVIEKNLMTWPDSPLVFTRLPELVREAAPNLYYLSYRAPAVFGAPMLHRSEVNPCGPITLKLNHVVHHAGPGHHVQNYFASRCASRIGQMAAVDCASRIAMFCGGTMAEGWACYATDLMEEAGFFTPAEKMNQEHTRLRMAARAIVDVKLHYGEMSFAEALELYRTHVGMSLDMATKEAARNSMFPGTAMTYLTGTAAIHNLRRHLEHRMSLREFHDRFLSYGSIPVPMIADLITRKIERQDSG